MKTGMQRGLAEDRSRGVTAEGTDVAHEWSQLRETVLMLELAGGQIVAAMRESDQSVDALVSSFTGMAGVATSMQHKLAALPELPEIAAERSELCALSGEFGGMVERAVVAFQFYDKLVQRLSHVIDGLAGLSDIVGEPARYRTQAEWQHLHDQIRQRFSTAEERKLCDAVLAGLSVEQALGRFVEDLHQHHEDIELF